MNGKLLTIHSFINKLPPSVPISLIVINCILYEWWGFFELESLQPFVVSFKIAIPLFLLLIVYPCNFHFTPFKRFIYFFAIFMVWGAISTIFSNFFMEGISQWAKFFFRFIFCIAVCLYFIKRPTSHQLIIMKILVIVAVATVVQYFILEMTSLMGWVENGINLKSHSGGVYYGPFGVLGNGTAQFSSFYKVPKFQIQGFWVEPSNASAFLFMASFIAEALYIETQKKMWMIASGICCIGGIFAFSNAGYFALGFALLTGQIVYFICGNKNRALRVVLPRAIAYHFLMATSIFLILFSLFGRYAVIKYIPNSNTLKAITGVRGELLNMVPASGQAPAPNIKAITIDDTMMKRGELAGRCFGISFYKIIMGEGFRITGVDSKGRGVVVSASAPVMWLFFTGIIGLIILLLRESKVILGFISAFPPSAYQLRIFQAWLVLFFQNMVYGTWMTPLYFLLIALIFSSLNKQEKSMPLSLHARIGEEIHR
ncbi:MAG: hypothetical protein ABIK92_18295 [Pseudomonadota bacterium]